jgi:RNA polymerase sigma factor (TIGR02999 family)
MDPTDSQIESLVELADHEPERASEALLELLYKELRALAIAMTARENPGQMIQASDLVHEAYLRLAGEPDREWSGRRHFFGAAAEAMRRILVEQARHRHSLRHGAGRRREALRESWIASGTPVDEILDVHDMLGRLEAEDPLKAAVVKMRYFNGMTIPETSEVLGISTATVERYWTYGRARLYRWITGRATS